MMFNVNDVRQDRQRRREQEHSAKRQRAAQEAQRRTQNQDRTSAWARAISVFL